MDGILPDSERKPAGETKNEHTRSSEGNVCSSCKKGEIMGLLGRLNVLLSATTASFQSDMGKAVTIAERNMLSIERAVKKASGVISASLTVAASAFAVKMKNIVDDADNLAKVSRKIGVATEELSALRYSADLAGVGFEEVTKGLIKLSKNAADASANLGSSRRAFDFIGVSVTSTDGSLRSINDILLDVADKFAAMGDGTKKAALAQELFGKAGADLIPMLNEGRKGLEENSKEAERFGIIIGQNTAIQAEKFNDNMTRLKAAFNGVFYNIANEIIPVLAQYSEQLREASRETNNLKEEIKNTDEPIFTWHKYMLALVDDIDFLGTELNALGKTASWTFGMIGNAAQGKFSEIAAEAKATNTELEKMFADLAKRSNERWTPETREDKSPRNQNTAAIAEMERAAEAQEHINELEEEGKKLRESLRNPTEILADTQSNLNELISSGAIDLETYNRASKKAIETYDKQAESQKRMNELEEEGKKLRESLRNPTEILADTQETLNELISSGAIDLETYNRAAKQAIETYDKQTKVAKTATNVMRDLGATFTSSAEEAVMSGQKFRDVLQGLAEDIERIMLRRMILEPFFNSLFGDAGIFSSLMPSSGTKTSSAHGNVFSSNRLLAYADGGIIRSRIQFPMANGGVGIAGEAGPEAIIPLSRTRGGDLGVKADVGGGTVVNVYAPPGSQVSQDRKMEGGIEHINIMIDEAVAGNVGRTGSKTHKAMKSTFGLGQRLTNR